MVLGYASVFLMECCIHWAGPWLWVTVDDSEIRPRSRQFKENCKLQQGVFSGFQHCFFSETISNRLPDIIYPDIYFLFLVIMRYVYIIYCTQMLHVWNIYLYRLWPFAKRGQMFHTWSIIWVYIYIYTTVYRVYISIHLVPSWWKFPMS